MKAAARTRPREFVVMKRLLVITLAVMVIGLLALAFAILHEDQSQLVPLEGSSIIESGVSDDIFMLHDPEKGERSLVIETDNGEMIVPLKGD